MQGGRGRRVVGGALLALLAAGCGDRGGAAGEAPPAIEPLERRVELRLYVAREWVWNDQDTVRVEVVNGTADPVAGTLHLFVQGPADLAGLPAGAETVSSGEGTRVSLPVRLPPGATAGLRQAVRTPPAPATPGRPAALGDAPAFAVRAWLTGTEGATLAERADTIRVRGGSDRVEGGCESARDVTVGRHGIGPVRLEMRAADLRALCPESRDTTWLGAEGMRERGLALRLSGVPAVALLADDRVARIVVDSAGLTTPAGVGVGSTLEALRARYGRACAGVGEGRIAVWFPAAPGISFGLHPAGAPVTGPRPDPAALPDSARVERLWVRAGTDTCPPPATAPEGETP